MQEIIVVSLSMVCDFCSSKGIVVAYLIEDFALPEYNWGSTGGFAACDICRNLVEGGRVKELQDRAYQTFRMAHDVPELPDEIVRQFIRRLHHEFWLRLRGGTRH
jgi:hypothetical protein